MEPLIMDRIPSVVSPTIKSLVIRILLGLAVGTIVIVVLVDHVNLTSVQDKLDQDIIGTASEWKSASGAEEHSGAQGNLSVLERRVNSIEEQLDTVYERVFPPNYTETCGGSILLKGDHEIRYRLPNSGERKTCAWVIWAVSSNSIRFVQHQTAIHFSSNFTVKIVHGFNATHCTYNPRILLNSANEADKGFIVVLFSGRTTSSNQGLQLFLKEGGSSSESKFSPVMVSKSGDFEYKFPRDALPVPTGRYSSNDRFSLLGSPGANKSVDVTLFDVDTELRYDPLILVYPTDPALTGIICVCKSGSPVPSRHTVGPNVPFVVLFRADGSTEKSGFSIRGSYDERAMRVSSGVFD